MDKTSKRRNLSLILALCLSMLIGGLISLFLGKDISWDMAGYHYYGPYAWLNNRWNIDYFAPSQLQLYNNPTLDLLTYFLINHFSPKYVVFIMGAIHGINIWLMFCLSYLLIATLKQRFTLLTAIALTAIGIYGPISWTEMGSFMGDNSTSIFVLGAILLLVMCWQHYAATQQLSKKLLFASGLLLGLGTALKLTVGFFIVSAAVSFIFLPLLFAEKRTIILWWGLGLALGLALFLTPWTLFLWQRYHNPIFPYFNQYFHSPAFPSTSFYDVRAFPKSTSELLFYPFYSSWYGHSAESPIADLRFPILYILLALGALTYCWRKFTKTTYATTTLAWHWLFVFTVASYVTWQIVFANLRYLVAIQIAAPLLIYFLVQYIVRNHLLTRVYTLVFLFVATVITMEPLKIARINPIGDEYFNMRLPQLVYKTTGTVLMAYSYFTLAATPPPQTYLIPFFPEKWRFIGVPINSQNKHEMTENIITHIKQVKGPIYILASEKTIPSMYNAAKELGFYKKGHCEKISTARELSGVLLCPLSHPNLYSI